MWTAGCRLTWSPLKSDGDELRHVAYEVKIRLSAYVRVARSAPIIIKRGGRPCAAVVGLDDGNLEAFLLGHHPRFLAAVDKTYSRSVEQG